MILPVKYESFISAMERYVQRFPLTPADESICRLWKEPDRWYECAQGEEETKPDFLVPYPEVLSSFPKKAVIRKRTTCRPSAFMEMPYGERERPVLREKTMPPRQLKTDSGGEWIMPIRKNRSIEVMLLIAVIVLGLNLNILNNEATNWDDPALFARPALQHLTSDNLRQVLSLETLSTYQPLRDLTYMADFALWGPGHNAIVFGMHLQSIVLFLLAVLACWVFLLALFRIFVEDDSLAFAWATVSSILFAVHPVHVESIAWLYARKEPLLALFSFLSLWAFIRARTGAWAYYAASGVFLLLAILSKPTALVIPGVMIVLDFAIQAKQKDASFRKTRLLFYVPVLLVVIPMGVRLITMMYGAGGVKPYHGGSFLTNLLAVSQILMTYVSLIGFTINYSADYPIQLFADPRAWQAWMFVSLNVIFIGSALIAYWKRHYLYAFFIAWFYIFLIPVSHIFPISQIMADRYALLPSLSWCVLLAYGLTKLWRWRLSSSRFSPEFPQLVSAALVLVIVISYSYMTFRQNDLWKNSQTLWEDTLAKYPNSSPGNVNLAAIYLTQMRFRDVQDLCLAAIREKPYDYLAMSNLALAQFMMGQFENAIHNYKQALKLKPDLDKAEKGLALAYWHSKDYQNAYALLAGLIASGKVGSSDNLVQYFYQTGYAAWKIGKKDEARAYLDKAMKYGDESPRLLDDIALAYTSMGDLPKAKAALEDLYPRLKDDETKKELKGILEKFDKKMIRQTY